MIGIWSKEYQIKKRAKQAVSTASSLLKKNSSKVESGVAEVIKEKLNQTEKALRDGNSGELVSKTDELEDAVRDHLSRFSKSKLRQNIEALLVAIALALLIRTFVVQPFKIPSGSMIPTLLVGDHLLVSKFAYGTKIPFTDKFILPGIDDIKPGDVIVFIYPDYENDPSKKGVHYIKRVIGLPGDNVDIRGRNLYINGEEVPLDFLGDFYDERSGVAYDEYEENLFGKKHSVIYEKGREVTQRGNHIPVQEVPEGHVFVMGDNRDNSQDSRFWGYVPIGNIEGKAFLIHWSWNLDDENILNKVRWNRIISVIN
ncbi:MAG: signal peptidase I [Deltaproteobacteria bacterium]|nr:signal peptidase I [Deltaproteobacteria bacterium]